MRKLKHAIISSPLWLVVLIGIFFGVLVCTAVVFYLMIASTIPPMRLYAENPPARVMLYDLTSTLWLISAYIDPNAILSTFASYDGYFHFVSLDDMVQFFKDDLILTIPSYIIWALSLHFALRYSKKFYLLTLFAPFSGFAILAVMELVFPGKNIHVGYL